MRNFKLLASLCVFLGFTSYTKSQNFISLNNESFNKTLGQTENAQLIDVRTAEEVANGAIKNSINISIASPNFEAQIKKLDNTKPIFVYCQGGGRSKKVAEIFHKLGFKTIYELDKGYGNWKNTN